MLDLDASQKFRVTAQNELRLLMVGTGATSIDDLITNLTQEAKLIGINVNAGSAYKIDGPFDSDGRDVIAEIRMAYANWIAAGKPTPPDLFA